MAVSKVAAIHDLSGLGKCSLTAAIPILSVMGVQACPMPTAVLSNQTGFESYSAVDLTGQMERTLDQWHKQDIRFDGIFTGFLMNKRQAEIVGGFIDRFRRPGCVVVVDPVLGDDGALYPVYDQEMVVAVGRLVAGADMITPNLTEACLLTGLPFPAGDADEEFVWDVARRITEDGPAQVVISGVHQGDSICNYAWHREQAKGIKVCNRRTGGGYSGTGDILASVVCGALVRGETLESGIRRAAALLEAAVAEGFADGQSPNEGIPFERHLHLLLEENR